MFSAAIKTAAAAGGYQISRSLRFNSADSAYLTRTPASASNRKTWTWSGWAKRSGLSTDQNLFEVFNGNNDNQTFNIAWFNSNVISIGAYNVFWLQTTPVYRDVSAWYHIVIAVDTTLATADNRIRVYVNGSEVTAFSTRTNPSQNADLAINQAAAHYIGTRNAGSIFYNGYLTEVNFIDGQALTPSSFGETNSQTGVWQPKAYSGSYGTNGFYLNFSDNSNTTSTTLGKDYSGNGNNWTPNNFSVTAGAGNDSLVDVPTNWGVDTGAGGEVRGNYCTLNPLNNAASLFNGNLDSGTASAIANWLPTSATLGVSSGKWYWEVRMNSAEYLQVGIFPITYAATSGTYPGSASTSGYGYQSANGNKYVLGTGSSYGATFTTGDVIGVALDLDAGTLVFYKNNVSQGTAASSISGTFVPGIAVYNSTGASTVANCNFGQRPFAYTAPSGYKALCTQNLPTPTIGATSTTQAGAYFTPNLWAGNDGAQTITNNIDTTNGGGLIWFKGRNLAVSNFVVNSNSGYTKFLASNTTAAEDTYDFGFTPSTTGFSFNSGSGSVNQIGYTYVAWQWKAGGTGVTNTAGSITSTVSANTTSGFSVVTWTGNGTAGATIGHGLGVAPALIIAKRRNAADNWPVYHSALGATYWLRLNSTIAAVNTDAMWNNTAPTSTVFTVKADTENNASGGTYVAYCFAEVPGYSRFGSYTGNGSSDGPFVYTGFRPAFVLIKGTSAGYIWTIEDNKRDTYNPETKYLQPQASDAEGTFTTQDFTSNGFKIRTSDTAWNGNGITYIFMAFAENPFKYSLAR